MRIVQREIPRAPRCSLGNLPMTRPTGPLSSVAHNLRISSGDRSRGAVQRGVGKRGKVDVVIRRSPAEKIILQYAAWMQKIGPRRR
jgi:hypothetical protein